MQKKPSGQFWSLAHFGLHQPAAEHLPPVQQESTTPPQSASVAHWAPKGMPLKTMFGRAPVPPPPPQLAAQRPMQESTTTHPRICFMSSILLQKWSYRQWLQKA